MILLKSLEKSGKKFQEKVRTLFMLPEGQYYIAYPIIWHFFVDPNMIDDDNVGY